jgi:phosphoglycolate phosphatase-like HAD superfamily hydrolase
MAPSSADHLLVLFDIDGTLVVSPVAALDAMRAALVDVTGSAAPADALAWIGGMTDWEIGALLLESVGADPHGELLGRWMYRYDAVHASAVQHVVANPGATQALAAAAQRGTASVLTGNLRPIAERKLRLAGLAGAVRWEYGAFGSEMRQRADLVRLAARRGARLQNQPLRLLLVGDTPRDVAAARAAGASCVAVASGAYDATQLAAAGAEMVAADLHEVAELLTDWA